ncbi:MAG: GNAT family N-acetyltransferase [Burkholderiales bacterium]|nr:GNAT family N-acetyltransferase [Burkholderiales bacterium]MDE2277291.1 GNAT family N-acetyltransferase [Burkholderiales bacterium]
MQPVLGVTLERGPVRLVPLGLPHEAGLAAAAADGALWKLRVTSVPEPGATRAYIETALRMQAEGTRQAFAVLDAASGEPIGCTSYHDILPAVERLEIGYTWYARRHQRTAVNTSAKWLLLTHAFETLGAQLVGWRTDNENLASQRAIERLGARKDGVLRHHALRRDGTVRDTVMYSLTAGEWPEVKARLEHQLARPR